MLRKFSWIAASQGLLNNLLFFNYFWTSKFTYINLCFSENSNKLSDYVYTKPYTRITPYLVGIIIGYLFSRKIWVNPKYENVCISKSVHILFVGYSWGTWLTVKHSIYEYILTEQISVGDIFVIKNSFWSKPRPKQCNIIQASQ